MNCLCGGNLYSKIQDERSVMKCTGCNFSHLNSVSLPPTSKYYSLEHAVSETAKKADVAMIKTFQGHFSPALWSKLIVEWRKNLHDEVMR